MIDRPKIGVGTGRLQPGTVHEGVKAALRIGYRLIDTAESYGTEQMVGEAIRASGIPREDLLVQTKVSTANMCRPYWALKKSLKQLAMDYVDFYLIHWPTTRTETARCWEEMLELRRMGLAKRVGFSNLPMTDWDNYQGIDTIQNKWDQLPWSGPTYGRFLQSYSQLEGGRIPVSEVLPGCKRNRIVPIIRSTNPKHMEENFCIMNEENYDE